MCFIYIQRTIYLLASVAAWIGNMQTVFASTRQQWCPSGEIVMSGGILRIMLYGFQLAQTIFQFKIKAFCMLYFVRFY